MQTNGIMANGITLDCVTSDGVISAYSTVASSTAITPDILAYAPATGAISVQTCQVDDQKVSSEYKQKMVETMKEAELLKRADSKRYNIPAEDPDAKTVLRAGDGKMRVGIYKDGKLSRVTSILPAIEDVKFYDQKVMVVYFADGTKETAKVDEENDYFDIEQGVSICIAKKLLSDKTDGNGTSVYNKLVEYAIKLGSKKRYQEALANIEEREREERLKQRHIKARKKREEKAAARREEQIEVQAEAYVRAMQKLKESE